MRFLGRGSGEEDGDQGRPLARDPGGGFIGERPSEQLLPGHPQEGGERICDGAAPAVCPQPVSAVRLAAQKGIRPGQRSGAMRQASQGAGS